MHRFKHNTIGRLPRGRGFTLVELIAVVAIIALLASIGSYGFMRARSGARKAMTEAMITSISSAMDQYKSDTLSYPCSYWEKQGDTGSLIYQERWYGSQILAQAMLGHLDESDDGYKGPGFRNRVRGKVFGPYIDANAKTRNIPTDNGDERPVLLDGFDNPILFYSFDIDNQEYVADHNKDDVDDTDSFDTDGPANLDTYVQAAGRYDYLIITPGEDHVYGETPASTDVHGEDDRNNFAQE